MIENKTKNAYKNNFTIIIIALFDNDFIMLQ